MLCIASALKRIRVRRAPQNACFDEVVFIRAGCFLYVNIEQQ